MEIVGVSSYCTVECRKAKPIKKPKAKKVPLEVRDEVRARDKGRCRYCGTTQGIQGHHILYRSQQGPDEAWNLISLCEPCHRFMHDNKRRWQKVLQMANWAYYTTGDLWTIPQAERALAQV